MKVKGKESMRSVEKLITKREIWKCGCRGGIYWTERKKRWIAIDILKQDSSMGSAKHILFAIVDIFPGHKKFVPCCGLWFT